MNFQDRFWPIEDRRTESQQWPVVHLPRQVEHWLPQTYSGPNIQEFTRLMNDVPAPTPMGNQLGLEEILAMERIRRLLGSG